MRRGILVAVAALLVFSLILPGLAEDKVLRIGYQPSTHHIAYMVAQEKGWWEKDLAPFGITKIEEYQFASGPPEMQAMIAGDLDVAYTGSAPPITAIAQGMDAKIVAAANINGSSLVMRDPSKYKGPLSLVGLKISTFPPGSIQDLVLKKWLADNAVDAAKVNLIGQGPGEAVTAIAAGQVDGVFLPHPSPAVIEKEGKGKTVVQSGQMWPNHSCCCVLVSGKLIKENPALVRQIVKTHINATKYAEENPDEAAEILAKKLNQKVDDIKYSVKTWDGRWVSDPSLEIASTMQYAAVDYNFKYINKKLTEKDLFDTSFYDSVSKSLKA